MSEKQLSKPTMGIESDEHHVSLALPKVEKVVVLAAAAA